MHLVESQALPRRVVNVQSPLRRVFLGASKVIVTHEVLADTRGLASIGRCAIDSLHATLNSRVVLSDHLLMEQLVRDSTETVHLVFFLAQCSELSHGDESTIEDDFSLGVLLGALKTESLDPSVLEEPSQEVFDLNVDIAEDDSLEALLVRQSELLQSNLVLFRLANWHQLGAEVLNGLFRWHNDPIRRLFRLALGPWLTDRLERHVFYLHWHRDGIENLLEHLWL